MSEPPVYSLAQAIERMGPIARGRYDDLKALVSDAEALQRALMERINAAEEKLAAAIRRRDHAAATGDAAATARLDAELAAARSKLDLLERERSRRNAARSNTDQVVGRLNSFIMQLFSGAIDVGAPPSVSVRPQLRGGETVTGAVERVRSEIVRARGELAYVRAAPLPADEIKALLTAEVDRLAAAGRPRVEVDGVKVQLHWADVLEFAAPGQALAAPSGSADKLICWLHRDRIVERLTADVEDAPGAIPTAERPGRVRKIEESLFALEVEEEFFVAEAIAAGLEVHRRPDASPWAILGWGLEREGLAEAAA